VDQNLSPQVGQWMFIPTGMIMIGFDQQNVSRTQFCQHKWKTSLHAFNLQSLSLNFKGKKLNNFDGKVGEEPVTHSRLHKNSSESDITTTSSYSFYPKILPCSSSLLVHEQILVPTLLPITFLQYGFIKQTPNPNAASVSKNHFATSNCHVGAGHHLRRNHATIQPTNSATMTLAHGKRPHAPALQKRNQG
jgi:hypothetical protein